MQDKVLGIQRSDKPRVWRNLDRCIEYLKKELHIARFELLDATNYSDIALADKSRDDVARRLRKAYEAATHDKWFREQVEAGLAEVNAPTAEWQTSEEANASWAKKRAQFTKRAESSAN